MSLEESRQYYESLDTILDAAQNVLVEIFTKRNLRGPNIERWRWDEPTVGLSWFGLDGIGRNIHAVVVENATKPSTLHVEANAWRDESMPSLGGVMVRFWKYLDFGYLPVPVNGGKLRELLQAAYNGVARLEGQDLDQRSVLSSASLFPTRPWKW